MKEWLVKRDSLSAYNTIFKELYLNDQEYFKRYRSSSLLYINVKKVFQEINNRNLFH